MTLWQSSWERRQRTPLSVGLVLSLVLRWQRWHHHWCCLEVPVGTTGRSFPWPSFPAFLSPSPWLQIRCVEPSPVKAQPWFPAQQNHLKNALRFHQHNSLYVSFFFFTLPSLDFFPKFIFSARLLTVGDCQPSATRVRVGARGCSAKRRMPGSGDQKHPTGWVYSHIYKKYFLAKICKTCKFGVRSCLCQNWKSPQGPCQW